MKARILSLSLWSIAHIRGCYMSTTITRYFFLTPCIWPIYRLLQVKQIRHFTFFQNGGPYKNVKVPQRSLWSVRLERKTDGLYYWNRDKTFSHRVAGSLLSVYGQRGAEGRGGAEGRLGWTGRVKGQLGVYRRCGRPPGRSTGGYPGYGSSLRSSGCIFVHV